VTVLADPVSIGRTEDSEVIHTYVRRDEKMTAGSLILTIRTPNAWQCNRFELKSGDRLVE
jgi:hypothetical protein